MKRFGYTVQLVLTLCASVTFARRNFDIIMTKADCIINDRTVARDFDCNLGRIPGPPEISVMNISATVLRPSLFKTFRFIVEVPRPEGNQSLTLINAEVKLCEFLNSNIEGNALAIFLKSLVAVANEVPKCPLKQNFTYTFNNFHVSPEDVPSYTPEAEFIITVEALNGRKSIGVVYMRAAVIYKRKIWEMIKKF